MNAIGIAALVLFMLAWLAGVVSWVVVAYNIARYWIQHFRSGPNPFGWRAVKAGGVFAGFVLIAMAAGLVGDWFGQWKAGWP